MRYLLQVQFRDGKTSFFQVRNEEVAMECGRILSQDENAFNVEVLRCEIIKTYGPETPTED